VPAARGRRGIGQGLFGAGNMAVQDSRKQPESRSEWS
jgi:hypothetical protein